MLKTINGKDHEFKFGVRFIRELDNNLPIQHENIEFGFGLAAKVLPELQNGNTNMLARALLFANRTEKKKVTLSELDDFIDEHEDIEKLFDEVLKEIAESNSGKLVVRAQQKQMKET